MSNDGLRCLGDLNPMAIVPLGRDLRGIYRHVMGYLTNPLVCWLGTESIRLEFIDTRRLIVSSIKSLLARQTIEQDRLRAQQPGYLSQASLSVTTALVKLRVDCIRSREHAARPRSHGRVRRSPSEQLIRHKLTHTGRLRGPGIHLSLNIDLR